MVYAALVGVRRHATLPNANSLRGRCPICAEEAGRGAYCRCSRLSTESEVSSYFNVLARGGSRVAYSGVHSLFSTALSKAVSP